jgi:hypothetical protein
MFAGWQSFYQMTGEAAATLVGLLFLVVSLLTGRPAAQANQGDRLFLSPTVFNLVSVLVISGLALAPDGEGGSKSVIMTGWALFGLAHSITRAMGLARAKARSHWTDFWWYGFAPAAAFLALAVVMTLTWLRWPHAAYLTGLCLMALLVIAIRNAWDLVTWLAPRRDQGGPG